MLVRVCDRERIRCVLTIQNDCESEERMREVVERERPTSSVINELCLRCKYNLIRFGTTQPTLVILLQSICQLGANRPCVKRITTTKNRTLIHLKKWRNGQFDTTVSLVVKCGRIIRIATSTFYVQQWNVVGNRFVFTTDYTYSVDIFDPTSLHGIDLWLKFKGVSE